MYGAGRRELAWHHDQSHAVSIIGNSMGYSIRVGAPRLRPTIRRLVC